ncbi:MAG: uroporphyrinogen decarboxylase [Eubacterium sp.]|nr:uroporphyrinogen decarboxylase [Eubacterium sp.]
MLTIKQNLLETIRGGHPDRYVKQFEPFKMLYATPLTVQSRQPAYGEHLVQDAWGVYKSWPEGTPGAFPVHDAEHKVITDIEDWKNQVKVPTFPTDEASWAPFVKFAEDIDRDEYFATQFYAPGIWEQCHYLMGVDDACMNLLLYPDEMHELIETITDLMVEHTKCFCKYFKPEAYFQHDDWGSQISTFMAPDTFEEFFLEPYKRVYGTAKENGVELIIHHSDSYAETLVPYMIEMGIDIWQGTMRTNNIPKIIEEYGGKLTIMGGIDSATVDFPQTTDEIIAEKVEESCRAYGTKFYIPCGSQGLAMSTFPGVYDKISENIDRMSKEFFGDPE